MNPINRINLLLSDILQNESTTTTATAAAAAAGSCQGSATQARPLIAFSEHDYHSSSTSPSVTAVPSIAPLQTRRNPSLLKHHRQRQRILQSDMQRQQQQPPQAQPLLNSSTLDDLFRALTLECEQYLTSSSISTHDSRNKSLIPSSTITQTNFDSNDDDYENLHLPNRVSSNGHSSLKTSIEVISPEQRQIVSVNVSSKLCPSSLVTSSLTYPLLSTSCITTSHAPTTFCQSSDDDSLDLSSSSTIRKHRRRRTRRQQIITPIVQSSSSSDERTEVCHEKKATISKRSCSTDHRQQRIKSIYDNQPTLIPSENISTRRPIRRRDISLQQNSTRQSNGIASRYTENLCSPLSVLLTSNRTTSDFVDRIQQQSQTRQSRLQFINHHQPLTLLDRMHHQFYHPSPTRFTHNNPNTYHNIPTHRIPSYPVY
ncbi:unnamed protein product [Adineta ricciae]|uniref:Uncharacterized protein n=1 Tax=Adineta ricciae TaxID=249248 RepID=A0A814WL24_ADIRI|nr:unnamed protein product [Adineta ricciae]CAF1203798.1 unnamed protein product [Adineta ricciae]